MKILQGKINLILLVFVFVVLMFSNSYSQGRHFSTFTYSVSIPTGDTKEFIDEISWRGLGYEYRNQFSKNATVGFSTGWNLLYEETREVTQLDTDPPGAFYGTQKKLINAFPIMISAHYYLGQRGTMRPYIGLSAGGYIMLQYFETGVFLWENNQWQWGIAPEAGIIIPVKRDLGIMINGKYNYTFTGESVTGSDINNAYWGINVGLAWTH